MFEAEQTYAHLGCITMVQKDDIVANTVTVSRVPVLEQGTYRTTRLG